MTVEMVKVTTPACDFCGKVTEMQVEADQLREWQRGALIQLAFPNMTNDERELLKMGTHPACWDAMFGPMDPEDR